MNGLSNILNKGVNGTEAIILGLDEAGRHSESLLDFLDNSVSNPSYVYGLFTGMAQTWNANLAYAKLFIKLYGENLCEAQVCSRVNIHYAYTTTRPTNVATTKK